MSNSTLRGTLLAAGLLCSASHAQVTFTDLAGLAGVNDVSFGRGAAMADLDGDGLLDLVAINAGMPNHYYRQTSPGNFVETSVAWGLVPDTREHWAGLVADFDNDGDDDVYIATGGFTKVEENQLLRNDLATTGQLTDVSSQSVAGNIASQNFGATTQDFDNDGDLDIFLTTTKQSDSCVVLSNNGNNGFQNVTTAVGIFQTGLLLHCSSGDFDNDGWADVAVGNLLGKNLLYRNKGDGSFKDLAELMGVASSKDNFGLILEDFDNDGFLDLFVPKYNNVFPPTKPTELYLNDKVGAFVNVTAGTSLTAQTDMGHNTGDLDGDGYPDIYIGTGNPDFKSPDLMYLVTPNGSGGIATSDISATSGILVGGDTRCHGMAFGDYDADGFVDIFVNNGGPSSKPQSLEPHYLLHAADNGSRWAAFELTGVRTNRSAIGAHVIATTSAGREVHRWRRAGHGFGNTNSPIQHVGIGTDTQIQRVVVRWPSGIEQTLLDPALFQVHQVIETGLLLTGPTVLGGQVDLDLVGPAGQVANLYFSGATAQLPLPGFGLLQLLPPVIPLGAATLDGMGQGTASFPIPASPSFLGLTVYLQGWFHEPLSLANTALSNAVSVTIQ